VPCAAIYNSRRSINQGQAAMAKIFLSFSRKDEGFARAIARALSELSARVYLDTESIPDAVMWSRDLEEGRGLCDIMLVVVSPEAMASSAVEADWQYALDSGMPVVLLLWRTAEVVPALSPLPYIDFINQPFDRAFKQLHTEITRWNIRLQPISAITGTSDTIARIPARPPLPIRRARQRARRLRLLNNALLGRFYRR
jgi:hypothetical protein